MTTGRASPEPVGWHEVGRGAVGNHRRRAMLLLAGSVAGAVAGCGGSDGGGGSAAPAPAGPDDAVAVPEPAPPQQPAPGVSPVAIAVDQVLGGLTNPWALCFLPDGRILVTERGGQFRFVTLDGTVSAPLSGAPAVVSDGQGGLLDVIASPSFSQDRLIYFTFAEAVTGGSVTAVARAVLGSDGLTGVTVLLRQSPASTDGRQYGSRLAFDRDGFLFATFGERFDMQLAQDLGTLYGKVARIRPDGAVPADNPAGQIAAPAGSRAADAGDADAGFAGAGVRQEIWTYGHRNPQGIALNPWSGDIWISDHGARGGDEVNRLRRGRNFGWPRITRSRDYTTLEPIGEAETAPDVEPALIDWVPVSPAPAGILFYTGDRLPGWEGSLLVGMLAGQRLTRLALDGDRVTGETRHLDALGERFRDIRQGPDGYPYCLTDSGRLYRIRPA